MTNKTALIIGASRGLGLGLAAEFADRGWQVTATARGDAPDLAALAAGSGGRISLATVDIDDVASITALDAALAGKTFDLVFVNAGVSGPRHGAVEQATPAEIAALMMTNAVAPVRLAKLLLPRMQPGGSIAFMTSILGSVALNIGGTMDLYRASKAALNSLSRSFYAQHIADKGLTVLNFHPGWVRTAMGGPSAPVEVAESVRGLADQVATITDGGQHFVDFEGNVLPW